MRKKLFAVIMSAMMMITFMPSMAFAADTTSYAFTDGLKTLKIHYVGAATSNFELSTESLKVYDGDNGWVCVKFNETTLANALTSDCVLPSGVTAATIATAVDAADGTNDDSIFGAYYDLTGARLVTGTIGSSTLLPSEYATKSAFENLFNTDGSVKSSLVTGFRTYKPATVNVKSGTASWKDVAPTNWTLNMDKPAEYNAESDAAQSFNGTAYFTVGTVASYEAAPYKFEGGNTIVHKFEIAKATHVANDVLFFADKVGKDADALDTTSTGNTKYYDGAEHKIVAKPLEGYTVTWKELNKKTGNYETITAPSYKGAEKHVYEATIQGTEKTDVAVKTIVLNVEKADVTVALGSSVQMYAGLEYTPYDLLSWSSTNTPKFMNEFVKANKKELKKAVDAMYTFKTTSDITVPNEELVTPTQTEGYVEAEKAFKAIFGDNVTVTVGTFNPCTVNFVAVTDNEIVTCNSSKTFHVKKAKALKANKTFQIKNDFVKIGPASYYKKSGNSKIKVAKSGKVTVKKGLKKGTYKVKLKVTAIGKVSDTKTLTVKVVK